MRKENDYESPKVRIVKAVVEKGFAASEKTTTEKYNRFIGSWE